jgi:CheY-like chemotaxis protein
MKTKVQWRLMPGEERSIEFESNLGFDDELNDAWGITIRRWPLNKEKDDLSNKQALTNVTTCVSSQAGILLAEDDDEMRTFMAWVLRRKGYEVTECSTGLHLLDSLGSFVLSAEPVNFDLIISDIRMPGVTGLEVLEGLQAYKGFPPVILITAFGDEETHLRARQLGAVALFDKPFDLEDLLEKVSEITGVRSINAEEHSSVVD